MSTEPTQSSPRRSHFVTRSLVVALAASLSVAGAACGGDRGQERWVATENTNVEIDWDAIHQAPAASRASPPARDRKSVV